MAGVLIAAAALAGPHPALSAPGLAASLYTVDTLMLFAAAAMLCMRHHGERLVDPGLEQAVLALAAVSLVVWTIPAATRSRPGSGLMIAQSGGHLLTGCAFAACALIGPALLAVLPRRTVAMLAGACLAAIGLLGAVALGMLPSATLAGAGASVAIAANGTAALLLVATGATFARRGLLRRDRSCAVVCIAVVLLAAAAADSLAHPTRSADQLHWGAILALGACAGMLVVGVMRLRRSHEAQLAAIERAQRRWIACDLHDGLAQDLAVIAAHSSLLSEALGPGHPVVLAATSALKSCRETIGTLAGREGASLRHGLELLGEELRARHGLVVTAEVDLDREPDRAVREQLLRIVREAAANSARHGGARHLVVSVRARGESLALTVLDDGCGLAEGAGEGPTEGFGLAFMRARAAALGGRLEVKSGRPGGTRLRMVVP